MVRVSKYRELILMVVEREEVKSTRCIVQELEAKSGKSINWHHIYKLLTQLEQEGKIKRLKSKAGILWVRA